MLKLKSDIECIWCYLHHFHLEVKSALTVLWDKLSSTSQNGLLFAFLL